MLQEASKVTLPDAKKKSIKTKQNNPKLKGWGKIQKKNNKNVENLASNVQLTLD